MRLLRAAALPTIFVLVFACSGGSNGDVPSPALTPTGSPASNATQAALLPTTVDALPEIDATSYVELLAQLKGTPVVVNLWGSWCAPCRQEAPDLKAAAERYGDRVQFIGVDMLDERTSAASFIREAGWSYPSVFDPDGAIRDSLGFLGQPVTIFYDADGQRVDDWQGPIPPEQLRAGIEKALA
ncbi:MAG: TlpA disulfide reductase family protein [Actinomycetota bacterium]